MSDERDQYLWDRSGEPDPEVQRLEELLRPFRHRGVAPVVSPRPARRHPLRLVPAAMGAAAAVVLGFVLWFATGGIRGAWTVYHVAGSPTIDGASLTGDGLLRRGGRLETDTSSRALLDVGRIGRVEVDPGTRLSLVASGAREHRLALDRGTIHARIWAPPRFFFVETPFAEAIDLGCAFTLHVDGTGAGTLRVTHGWVQFAYGGREALIPQGAIGATRPGVGPGTPRYEDAPHGYDDALAVLDFGAEDDPRREEALEVVLSLARREDALTLWHLLSRGTAPERTAVFDRLEQLSPPPPAVTREAVLSGDRAALMRWWDSFEFEGTSFWGRLRQRF